MVSAFAGQKRPGLRFSQIGQDKRTLWDNKRNEPTAPASEGGRYKSERVARQDITPL
jgi:hypothetical protein